MYIVEMQLTNVLSIKSIVT